MRVTILPVILCVSLTSMNPRTPASERLAERSSDFATFSLKYSGTVIGITGVSMEVKVDVDTSIGFRYEISYQGRITRHAAIFYKFSAPDQVIKYDFATHKSKVIQSSGQSKDPVMLVTNKMEVVNGYSCTHLYYENELQRQDYYMSKSVPGFSQAVRVLQEIDPSIKSMAINHTIFNYGGLVKLDMTATNPKTGQTYKGTVNLVSAQSGIPLPQDDFDVPSN